MGRYEISQDPINIAYGWDHVTGFFLTVVDTRLQWSETASESANAIAEEVNPDGGGGYFDLHTGPHGFGYKVDNATLVHFWEKYGVPAAHLEKVRTGIQF